MTNFDTSPLGAFARRTDPETSRSAARSVKAESISGKIIAALRERGPMTTRELAEHIGRDLVTVSPRIAPLVAKGIVRNSGELRKGASGANSTVWELVEN